LSLIPVQAPPVEPHTQTWAVQRSTFCAVHAPPVTPHTHAPVVQRSTVNPLQAAPVSPQWHAAPTHLSLRPVHGLAPPHLHAPPVQRSTFCTVHSAVPPQAQLVPKQPSAVVVEQSEEHAAPLVCAQLGKVPWTTQWLLAAQHPPPESAAHLT
jgi:hypothetical protein